MESPENRGITAALAHRVGKGANGGQIADVVVSAWKDIKITVGPIIGQRGVAALYQRSLYLTGPAFPWLAAICDSARTDLDLAGLKTVLAQQESANAAAGGAALLQTYYELLTSLVGPSLTERLFRSVWTNSLGDPPAQDASP